MSSPSQTPVADGPRQPIIFKCPGLELDTRLNVFGQEFHVHSAILRLYSAFFRTFLDSPDKTPAPASAFFRYEYVSVVDDDGTWGLEVTLKRDDQKAVSQEAGSSPTPAEGVSHLKTTTSQSNSGNPKKSRKSQARIERLAFGRLLYALYRERYTVSSMREFGDIVRLADFYCALPAVSRSVDSVLLHSPELIRQIPDSCFMALQIAHKLRHPLLFREALVHVVSDWVEGSTRLDVSPELAHVVNTVYNRLQAEAHKVTYDILRATAANETVRRAFESAVKTLESDATTGTARFFRLVYNSWPRPTSLSWCGRSLKALQTMELLLTNDLSLARLTSAPVHIQAGGSGYERKFFCASIEDHELPWDKEAVDW
ncbi:hypothetical protein LSUB1_G008005 [Lachnellula subtilissima]|uniref:BTB domain-containing protein n=1 Tax=Lachnellula subtilissima TaxID=602034 RepID=A0A8H8RHG6_9HELO|nr:hypothetical protein LSUB1_G008005 [Lachnellula subtilissima]